MDTEAQNAIGRLNGLLSDLDDLDSRLAAARAALKNVNAKREEQPATAGVDAAANNAPNMSAEATEDIDSLASDLSEYEHSLADLKSKLEEAIKDQPRIAELESQLQQMASKDNRIAELESQLKQASAKDTRIAELESQLEQAGAKDNRIAALESQLEQAGAKDNRIAALESQLEQAATKDNRIADLESQLEQAAAKDARIAELEGLESVLKDKDKAIAALNATVENLSAKLPEQESVREKLLVYEKKLAVLEQDLREKETQTETLNAKIQAYDTQLRQREEKKRQLEEQFVAAQKEIETLRAQSQQASAEAQEQKNAVAALQQELQQRDATLAQFEETIKKNDAEAVALRENLQRELDEKSAQVKAWEETLRTTEEKRAKLELEVKMLLGEIEGARYQANEIDVLQGKVAKLEKELQEERDTIVKLKARRSGDAPAPSTSDSSMNAADAVAAAKRIHAANDEGKGRRGNRKQMGAILVEAGVLTEEQLADAIAFQKVDPKQKLGSVIVDRGYATEDVIAAALAAQMHVRFIENLEDKLQPDVIKLVPTHLLSNHRCVPLSMDEGELLVAMANPLDLIGIENIELATKMRVDVAAAAPGEIDRVIAKYFTRDKTST